MHRRCARVLIQESKSVCSRQKITKRVGVNVWTSFLRQLGLCFGFHINV
jgi:hypothetical protein